MSRNVAIADYIVTMRKLGDNDRACVWKVFETHYGDDNTDDEMTAIARANWHDLGNRSFG